MTLEGKGAELPPAGLHLGDPRRGFQGNQPLKPGRRAYRDLRVAPVKDGLATGVGKTDELVVAAVELGAEQQLHRNRIFSHLGH